MKNISEIMEYIKIIEGCDNDSEVASSLDMTLTALSNHKARKSIPYKKLSTYCERKNISLDSLLGDEKSFISPTISLFYEEFLQVNVYALAGAGDGKELVEREPIEVIVLPKSFCGQSIIPVKIKGESMEPTIYNGAVVGIDRDDRQIVSGKLYIVWLEYEGAVLKRLFVDPERIVLKSDNPQFPVSYINIKEGAQDFVLGRVKWVIQKF